jgi:hypothetical protein
MIDCINDLDDARLFLFPPNILNNPFLALKRAFLSPRNIYVDEFNDLILQHLPGNMGDVLPLLFFFIIIKEPKKESYYSANVIKEDEDNDTDPDFLTLLNHNGIPLHHLRLKIGCICSLMRNMSVQKGLVKNTRLIIEQLHHRFIQVRVINNLTNTISDPLCIPRIRFEFTPNNCSWTVTRIQFPLRLAYATTFHGCVGLTLDKTVLDTCRDVFTHGQLYTSLSRVRNRTNTRLLRNEKEDPDKDHLHLTTNIVYKDLLL